MAVIREVEKNRMAAPALRPPKSQWGLTLVEILVTLVILSIGLLGTGSLLLESLRNNQSAYLRTQASILAYDMSERIRTNSEQATDGAYDDFSTDTSTATAPNCGTTTGCSPSQLVTLDKAEWTAQVEGTGAGAALLPEGVGKIARAGNVFTITIQWKEGRWDEDEQERQLATQQFALDFRL